MAGFSESCRAGIKQDSDVQAEKVPQGKSKGCAIRPTLEKTGEIGLL